VGGPGGEGMINQVDREIGGGAGVVCDFGKGVLYPVCFVRHLLCRYQAVISHRQPNARPWH
jgi:hypothetical protein